MTDIAYSDLRRIPPSLNSSGFRDWAEIYLWGAFDQLESASCKPHSKLSTLRPDMQ